jgi:hypothetical protein
VSTGNSPLATGNTSLEQIDIDLAALKSSTDSLASSSIDQRVAIAKKCLKEVVRSAVQWAEVGCARKRSGDTAAGRAEELLAGPITTIRMLHLTIRTMLDVKQYGSPCLPGKPRLVQGQWRIPVFPTKQLFDRLAFIGLHGQTWMQTGVERQSLFGDRPDRLLRKVAICPGVEVILGAGNVSAIAVTDTLSKIFHEDRVVLLKMNAVNDYLTPILLRALKPLIDQGWLRIVSGGAAVGSYAIHHPRVDSVHITGSKETHETIVWGSNPLERPQRKRSGQTVLGKAITSELGNVTPWIIVPGSYSDRQLWAQAQAIAASITNNASFNCIATKLIITCRSWPQRQQFLSMLEKVLSQVPPRYAYYPGALERYKKFSGRPESQRQAGYQDLVVKDPLATSNEHYLPWTVRKQVDPQSHPDLFQQESFVCVAGETCLQAEDTRSFLSAAVHLVNHQVAGTLAVALTLPSGFAKRFTELYQLTLASLRYATIGINQWPALGFAWMSPPWGGYPGATLADIESGLGTVHNTYLLERPEKTIIAGPLQLLPKPVWFATHRHPDIVAERLLRLYCNPGLLRLPKLFAAALWG